MTIARKLLGRLYLFFVSFQRTILAEQETYLKKKFERYDVDEFFTYFYEHSVSAREGFFENFFL